MHDQVFQPIATAESRTLHGEWQEPRSSDAASASTRAPNATGKLSGGTRRIVNKTSEAPAVAPHLGLMTLARLLARLAVAEQIADTDDTESCA